ncbi:hypothetical protein [Kitasatospora mediocidica]|nr:hypothetical protein [Kitasatospora mediocidica]
MRGSPAPALTDSGRYCGLDQAWDGYSQQWAYQEQVCVTVP